jgi:hypothetical protein
MRAMRRRPSASVDRPICWTCSCSFLLLLGQPLVLLGVELLGALAVFLDRLLRGETGAGLTLDRVRAPERDPQRLHAGRRDVLQQALGV